MSNLKNKRFIYDRLSVLAECPLNDLSEHLNETYSSDVVWKGSHPMNECKGLAEVAETFWRPLKKSLPDLERRDLIMVGGNYEDRQLVAAMGHYCGTFKEPWHGIPSTGGAIYLRYGEVFEIKNNKIIKNWVLVDVLDFIRQAGIWPIAPSLGTEEMWPGPITADGLVISEQDRDESVESISQTLNMHAALANYNDHTRLGRQGLLEMEQKEFWHPRMMWYGPSGIGTCRGLEGFVDVHQLPFRIAFPNRKGSPRPGNENSPEEKASPRHYIRIGDGKYSVTGGWPSVHANHLGGDWLGTSPTGRKIEMRVMDFYLHHEGLIRENWVPLDIIHVLLQMDIDIMKRIRNQFT